MTGQGTLDCWVADSMASWHDLRKQVLRSVRLYPSSKAPSPPARTALTTSPFPDKASPFRHVPPQPAHDNKLFASTVFTHPVSPVSCPSAPRHRRRGAHQHYDEPDRCLLASTASCRIIRIVSTGLAARPYFAWGRRIDVKEMEVLGMFH